MKYFVLCLFLFTNFNVQADSSNPRNTFRTFLKAMVQIKENTSDKDRYYKVAISTLRLATAKNPLHFEIGKKYSDSLIKVLDRIKKVDYEKIPPAHQTPIWYFDKRLFQGQLLEISLIKYEDKWLFSAETLESLKDYEKALSQNSEVSGVKILRNFSDQIRSQIPKELLTKSILFENWQWLGFLIILLTAFLADYFSRIIITFFFGRYSKIIKATSADKLSQAIAPLGKIALVLTTLKLINFLDFSPEVTSVIKRVLYIAMSIMTVWFAHKMIQFFAFHFAQKATSTISKFDDILVPLLSKTAFVVTYLLGGLLVASSLTIDVTSIIAGLGIGGLAFAFAAKDTLSNFFGSIMLVLDRPFDIGDIIVAADVEGVVTEVGFRSTRIRTFNDSLITIANGELMNRPIDNKGKRRFRRLVTNLGLEYDTPPEKIEAFCEGIRQLIVSYKWTRKDNFHVYFANYAASSLDIKMVVYWITDEYSRELSEKHRLMIDILRLAKELEVEFAFPTQTLHLFNETKAPKIAKEEQYLQEGIEKAKSVIKKPLSLKNPRSNSEDKDQFGDNGVGI